MFPKWFRRLKRRRQTSGQCVYCGVQLSAATATRDHVVPKSKGGTGRKSNIVIACENCNREKRDMMPDEFIATRRTHMKRGVPTTEADAFAFALAQRRYKTHEALRLK